MTSPPDHSEECVRIQRIVSDHGVILTLSECEETWRKRSEDWHAGWLYLPYSDEKVWDEIKPFIPKEPA